MATNFLQSTQKQDWFFSSKEEMDTKYSQNMEEYKNRVDEMLKHVTHLKSQNALPNVQSDTVIELKDFKNYNSWFKKSKNNEFLLKECMTSMKKKMQLSLRYSNKICYTAITFFRRFYFKNSILEHNPYHIALVCIILAAKVEERNISDLREIFQRHFSQEPEYQNLNVDSINQLEVKVCQSLGFQFYVHSAIASCHHILHELQTRVFQNNKDPQYIDIQKYGEDFALKTFNSQELVFCFSPNVIACAAIELAIQKNPQVQQNIGPLGVFLNLPEEAQNKIQQALQIYSEFLAPKDEQMKKTEKTTLKQGWHFRKTFYEKNYQYTEWMDMYLHHCDNLLVSDEWFEGEDEDKLRIKQTQQMQQYQQPITQKPDQKKFQDLQNMHSAKMGKGQQSEHSTEFQKPLPPGVDVSSINDPTKLKLDKTSSIIRDDKKRKELPGGYPIDEDKNKKRKEV